MDWEINVRFARLTEFSSGVEALGQCNYFEQQKVANILVIAENDFSPGLFHADLDHEYILVHELCHLLHAYLPLEDEEYIETQVENLVHLTAQALVQLDRELLEALNPNEITDQVEVRLGLSSQQDDARCPRLDRPLGCPACPGDD
jgi:hypothetical protein